MLRDKIGAKALAKLLSCSSEYPGSPFVCPLSVSPGVFSSFTSSLSFVFASLLVSSAAPSFFSSVFSSGFAEGAGEEGVEGIDAEEEEGVEGVVGVEGAVEDVGLDGGGVLA